MPTGLKKLLLDRALNQDKNASSLKDIYGQSRESIAPIALGTDKLSSAIISQRQKTLGLTFEEDKHVYTMNGRKDYPSVSKVLKKFPLSIKRKILIR